MGNVGSGALLMASLEGQTLGQYKVIEQMGSGGMATVYKAYHPRLDRYVAIKMLHEAFQEDKNFLARFEREAQIVARLEHPHIVPVFDFDEYHGRPYLVMKYVEGRTLKAELDSAPPTLADILSIMTPVADALDYAHRQGVLHRDIKPSNIIIDTTAAAYVTDFGLARMAQLGDSTLSHDVLLGTPHYISPEQAMGNRDLDSRTDLYSLGVVLFELVVGRVPFSADTPFAVIHDQIYRPLPKPSSINPEITAAVDAVLEKALAKAPAERYTTATEMIDAFRRAVEQSNMTALDPDRSSVAAESLAKLRDAQTLPPVPSAEIDIPAPVISEAEPTPAPLDEEEDDSPESWVRGFPNPPSSPYPPTPREVRKAKREVKKQARREAKRVIEASLDFSNAERAIQSVGDAVRSAVEGISNSFDRTNDPDLMPLDDEEAIRRRVEIQFNKRKEFGAHVIVYIFVNALLWVVLGSGFLEGIVGNLGGILSFPIVPVVMLAWGSGLAAHAVETYYVTGERAASRLHAIHDEFYRAYGDGWRRANRKDLRQIRDRVSAAINKRREFIQHLAVFAFINLMLWVIYAGSAGTFLDFASGFPWPLIVMLGWGIGLVSHAFEAMTAASRERAISRAVERERDRLYEGEKPKRDRQLTGDSDYSREVRLTEDGEFTESMIEDIDAEEKAKRDHHQRGI